MAHPLRAAGVPAGALFFFSAASNNTYINVAAISGNK